MKLQRLDKQLLIVIALAFAFFCGLAYLQAGPAGFALQFARLMIYYAIGVVIDLLVLFIIAAIFRVGFGAVNSAVIRLASLVAILQLCMYGLLFLYARTGYPWVVAAGLVPVLILQFSLFANFFDLEPLTAFYVMAVMVLIEYSLGETLRQVVRQYV